jgi:acyl-coenzyme A thioesterase PaaI-like protein
MSQRVASIKALVGSPQGLRRMMNLWPPFLATGVRVQHIAPDWRQVRVKLVKTPLTTNYFGTQFGGSMFAMVDPFFVIMLVHNLGPEYVVWDQRAEIEYLAPGRTSVHAELTVTEDDVAEIREAADRGDRVRHWFGCDLVDRDGAVVARVRKQTYVRRQTPAPVGR